MKIYFTLFLLFLAYSEFFPAVDIPADHPYIQYFGRWDFTNPQAPSHSWPGVYIYAEFEGTSISIKMNDNFCYYNVIIDGNLSVFHGTSSGVTTYSLASGLSDGNHTIAIYKRNETWTKYTFYGFVLDDGKNLLPPAEEPLRKIEFIGDSFTSASGNEWTGQDAPQAVEKYTNIYEGFGPITARYFNAQYQTSSRSGYGMVMDYLGNYNGNLPDIFDQTHLFTAIPKWDYEQWIPNLVVICLGLNDYSGFGGWNGLVPQDKKELFKSEYHKLITTLRDVYQGAKILAVAAHVEWIKNTVSEVVAEQKTAGHNDIFYTYFPYYDGGYVNNGHPNVATHHKIAERLISAIDTINAWEAAVDTLAPKIIKLPESPFIVYDTTYTLEVETDSYAAMRLSTQDKSFAEMEFEFSSTGKRDHSVVIPCEHNKNYTFYLRAQDINGNQSAAAVLQFAVDTTKILSDWNDLNYDHSTWKLGTAPIGSAGNTGVNTVCNSSSTVYFTKRITIDSIQNLSGFGLLVKGHDGAIVYLNGQEAERINIFDDAEIDYSTLAIEPMPMNKMVVINSTNDLSKLHNGENIIGVEVHSASVVEPGIIFDSQFYNSKNFIYYKLGSDWNYYDEGSEPSDQISGKVTDIESNNFQPASYNLFQNYPNPFNPITVISWQSPLDGWQTIKIYDVLGREVAVLVDEYKSAGKHSVKFDASILASGTYICKLVTGDFVSTKKLQLLK